MFNDIGDSFIRVYQNFVMRDLIYAIGGGIVLTSVLYFFDLIEKIDLSSINFYTFIVLIAVSYVIGLIIREGAVLLRLKIKKQEETKVPGSQPYINFMVKVEDYYGSRAMLEFQRIVFMYNFGLTIGLCCLISGIIIFSHYIFIYNCKYDLFVSPALIGIGLMLYFWEVPVRREQQNNALKDFADNMN